MNVVAFFTETYDKKSYHLYANADEDGNKEPHNSNQVWYKLEHPCHRSNIRIIRPNDHNTLPNFIGSYFPRNNDPETYQFYCACMLLLFKPWQCLARDLKERHNTWTTAFDRFLEIAPDIVKRMISNIQCYHETDLDSLNNSDERMTCSSKIGKCDELDNNTETLVDSQTAPAITRRPAGTAQYTEITSQTAKCD